MKVFVNTYNLMPSVSRYCVQVCLIINNHGGLMKRDEFECVVKSVKEFRCCRKTLRFVPMLINSVKLKSMQLWR